MLATTNQEGDHDDPETCGDTRRGGSTARDRRVSRAASGDPTRATGTWAAQRTAISI